MPLTVIQPSRVTVMIKPVGALCNLDCTYCYYLPTKTIFGGREHRMTLRTLESIYASILPRFADDVTIAWQGGEPTLAGLPFFRKALEFQKQYARPGQRIHHALQTNGTLLDDDWCVFLRENQFLIGLSVDGPAHLHDHYRLSNAGRGTHGDVMRGLRLLQKHAVDYNILCVLNDFNVNHPDDILQFLLNLGSRWLQFIPAIEWEKDPQHPDRNVLAPYSPRPEGYGRFLCRVFDQWFERYRKRVSVRIFDAVLNKLVLGQMPFCILDGSCHNQLTIEHDGAVFGCDHFVERRWQLAQIGDAGWANDLSLDGDARVGLTIHGDGYQPNAALPGRDIHATDDVASRYDKIDETGVDPAWFDRADNPRLANFAQRKQRLPDSCVQCQWKPYCHGGCPKHRSQGGEIPEPTILCESYKMFYNHAMPRLEWLAGYLRAGQQPPDPPAGPGRPAAPDRDATPARRPQRELVGASASPAGAGSGGAGTAGPGRNDLCPCGSGLKYKRCHGRSV